MSLEGRYVAQTEKVQELAEDRHMQVTISTSDFPIMVTFEQYPDEQLEIGKEAPNYGADPASLQFIFGDGSPVIKGELDIGSDDFKKLLGASEKLSNLFMWSYFKSRKDFERGAKKETEAKTKDETTDLPRIETSEEPLLWLDGKPVLMLVDGGAGDEDPVEEGARDVLEALT